MANAWANVKNLPEIQVKRWISLCTCVILKTYFYLHDICYVYSTFWNDVCFLPTNLVNSFIESTRWTSGTSVRIIPGSGTLVSLCHGGIFVLVQRRWRTSAGKSWWFAWKNPRKNGKFRKSKNASSFAKEDMYISYIYIHVYIIYTYI